MKTFFKILFAIVAVLSVCSCNTKRDYDYSRFYKSDDDEEGYRKISVMSFNVRISSASDAGDRNWEVRKAGVFEMLKSIHPIVWGAQEAEPNQTKDIMAALPEYGAIGVDLHSVHDEVECDAIFYDKDSVQVLNSGTFFLTSTPDTPSRLPQSIHYRVCTWGRFKLIDGGREFYHFNTHLDTKAEARPIEMEVIFEKIKEINNEEIPAYLTADFNTGENDEIFKPLLNYGYKSARKEALTGDSYATYTAWGTVSQIIDHCFFYNFYAASKFTTIRQPWAGITYISDHYPISIILKFE